MTKRNAKFKKVETRIKDPDLIELRRRQIAEGAIKVFLAKGYDRATVREIAEEAGLTMGTMYNYVRTKEDIIYVVYDLVTRALSEEMVHAIAEVDDPSKQLSAALKHNLAAIDRRADEIMFLYRESGSLDRESLRTVLAREAKYIEMFEDCIRNCLGDRKVSDFKIGLAADILSYLPVIVTLRRWNLKRRPGSMEQILDGIFDFMMHGLGFLTDDDMSTPKGSAGDRTGPGLCLK